MNMPFDFGCASPLYARHRHPRLLCGPEDLPRLRRRIRRGIGRTLMEAIRARMRPHAGRIYASLAEIAIVGLLDDDARAIESARDTLAAIPSAAARGEKLRTHPLDLLLAFDLLHDRLLADERAAIVRWIAEVTIRETLTALRKGHYLHHAAMNIPMEGMIVALFAVLAVEGHPDGPDLSAEKAELMHFFEATLFTVVGDEGYPAEDIGYGTLMVARLSILVEALRRAGWYDAYTQCPRYARFGQAMLHFVQPWGKFLSNTGDYGAEGGPTSPVLQRLASETRDPALRWLQGELSYPVACAGPLDLRHRRLDCPEVELYPNSIVPVNLYTLLTLEDLTRPVHPARTKPPTQFMDPQRGIVSFRSSWKPDATFVVFDGSQRSPSAQGHAHDSGGHFSLSALGEYFAIDTGRYNIEQDQHNVVLVDGKSGQSTDGQWRMSWYQAALADYRPSPFVDAATVNNSQMANCYWSKRTLGLVKDPTGCGAPAWVWTVEDVNKANDYRQFWWAMNMHPDHRIKLAKDHATVTGSDHGNCLDIFFVLPAPTAYPKPHTLTLAQDFQEYGSYSYRMSQGQDMKAMAQDYRKFVGHLEYGPVFRRPRLLGKVAGYNGRFMALMIPRCKGAALPIIEPLPTLENALAVRLTFGHVVDTLIWAYEHHLLEADGIVGRGNWCVVRRDRRNGKVLAWEMTDGTDLRVDGKSMPIQKSR